MTATAYETITTDDIVFSFLTSVEHSDHSKAPYGHWFLRQCLPDDIALDFQGLPFKAPSLYGVSGKRELHNATRRYFDKEVQTKYLSAQLFAQAFQDERVLNCISQVFNTNLHGSYLRIEYAQDTDGFWLEPHTDLGVKLFTMLLYLSDEDGHENLGTDIYDQNKKHVARSPFEFNSAMVFIPSNNTYHGFEPRPIPGIRKSLIINYVTDEWRAKEQLANPERPITYSLPAQTGEWQDEQSRMDWAWRHGVSHGGAYSPKRQA